MSECFSKPPQAEDTGSSNRHVCVCDPVSCLVKEVCGDMERINKETGELSASGESTESTELTSNEPQIEPGHEEETCAVLGAATALQEQLLQLAKATAEDREEQLLLLLPIFIQVTNTTTH